MTGTITATVSPKRALAFFALDLVKIAALCGLALYLRNGFVAAAAAFWTAFLVFFAWKRFQTTGWHGALEIDTHELRFRRDRHLAPVDTLALAAVRRVSVEVWRTQRLLKIDGGSREASLFLPDIYDITASELQTMIARRLKTLG